MKTPFSEKYKQALTSIGNEIETMNEHIREMQAELLRHQVWKEKNSKSGDK